MDDGDRYIQYQLVFAPEDENTIMLEDITIAYDNLAIEAEAGENRIVAAGRSVLLDGTESEGLGLSYVWSIFSGEGTLSDYTTSTPTYTASSTASSEAVEIVLTVFDSFGQKDTDTVTITVVEQSEHIRAREIVGNSSQSIEESLVEDSSGNSRLDLDFGDFNLLLPESMTTYSFHVSANNTLVIGTPLADSNKGAVYVANSELAEMSGEYDLAEEGGFTKISGQNTGDFFGRYTVVAENTSEEEIIVVSAPGAGDYGKLYFYDESVELIGMMIGDSTQTIGALKVATFVSSGIDIVLGPNNTAMNDNLEKVAEVENISQVSVFSADTDFTGVSTPTLLGEDAAFFDTTDYQSFSIGDVNKDSSDDLILINTDGDVLVYFGSLSEESYDDSDADIVITGGTEDEEFGVSVIVGQVNEDAVDDIIVGAPSYGDNQGAVYIMFGSTNWETNIDLNSAANIMRVEGAAGDEIGDDLIVADYDGNGTDEIYTYASDEDVYLIDLTGSISEYVESSSTSSDVESSSGQSNEGDNDNEVEVVEASTCGNGTIEDDEGCDDGNTEDEDGCSSSCAIEAEGTTGEEVEGEGSSCSLNPYGKNKSNMPFLIILMIFPIALARFRVIAKP